MKIMEKIYVHAKGEIIQGRYEKNDKEHEVGEIINYENVEYEIRDIERYRMYFGLVVKRVENE